MTKKQGATEPLDKPQVLSLSAGDYHEWERPIGKLQAVEGKFEVVCGPQEGRAVLVEYAASGVLRGLELR